MRIRDNLDRSRRISPLIKPKNAVIVPTDKLKNIKGMINKMSNVLESVIKKEIWQLKLAKNHKQPLKKSLKVY